jgi:16S rRNA (guanine527-N7)-methyltransferase
MKRLAEVFGPEQFAARAAVSRETLARLKLYAGLLSEWNARHNLVSKASLQDMWRRHFWDSAQLAPLVPDSAKTLVDLGAGAGFPALVLAELFRERTGFRTVLYESTAKKCRFLEEVRDRLALPAEIRNARIEDAQPEPFDVVTARACAPLPRLFVYAQAFWGKRTVGLFLKGQNVEAELTEARKSWRITSQRHPSQSDPSGVVLELREFDRVPQRSPGRH